MYKLKLTNTKTEEFVVFEVNKTVEKWLWNNFHDLGFDQIENLTNMGVA